MRGRTTCHHDEHHAPNSGGLRVRRAAIRPRLAVALVVALFAASPAGAATYGDIDVTVESEPRGPASHGYAELWVRVANTSTSAAHAVRLTYPRSSYTTGVDHLRAVTRTVTVEPGKVVRVALAYPERIPAAGDGLGVAIDGREQPDAIRVGLGPGYVSPRPGVYGYGPQPLVLYSLAVDTRFPDWARHAQVAHVSPSHSMTFTLPDFVRADRPAEAWSPNWLGYSRYDGVVVTADDLRKMPAEVKSAVGQYVECGGSLLVYGGTAADLPGPWTAEPGGTRDLTRYAPGFGECFQTRPTEFFADENPVRRSTPLRPAHESWVKTLAPWQRITTPGDANRGFPVVDDLGLPTTGLLSLMFVFVVVIGPLNLYLLARWKRKLWLFWTVPAISLVTCLLVFVTMAATEGWTGRTRVEGFTILDETSRRASTIGVYGFYAPLVPRGGLHFSPDTEVTLQNGDDHSRYNPGRSGSPLTIDWTHEQNLASGWLAPRVPAHVVVRKGEQRRERVTFTRGAGGTVEAVNGLGADLTVLWYADDAGVFFHARNVPAGGRATLTPEADQKRAGPRVLRSSYTRAWAGIPDQLAMDGPNYLAPRTYLAIMDAAPFLDDGLAGGTRTARSAVLGLVREEP